LAKALVIQPDGKIVVAGCTVNAGNCTLGGDILLIRYNTDGSLDTSFGTGGIVTTDILSGTLDIANGLAIQTDGKLVIAGCTASAGNCAGGADILVARYTITGTLDTSFGTNGLVITDLSGTGSLDVAHDVVVQPDGRIVVGGCGAVGIGDCASGGSFAVLRYSSTGLLDPTFSGDGKVITTIFDRNIIFSVALQPDGKIVAGGCAAMLPSSCTAGRFALLRITPSGALDTTFGGSGKRNAEIGPANTGYDVAVQPDGKIVIVGCAAPMTGNCNKGGHFGLLRYNPNGDLDVTFDLDGKFHNEVSAFNVAYAVVIQTDGKIVAVGCSAGPSSSCAPGNLFGLARYED
jgi:uncharacterized delta-60 repeat protein